MRIRKIGTSLLVSLLLIVTFHVVSGSLPQQDPRKKRIEILNSDLYTYDSRIIANADRLIGNVKLSHNNVLLYCDSAYSYKDSNMVDAFGHVHIIQGDTLNLYGDRIKYEGNTKIARIKGNVKLVNKSITLTTDELIFDLRANVGNYHTWGKIIDTANVLVSKIGRYYSNEDLCFFKDSVKVTNKDFVLTADTLKYNSKTERVFIVGPTHIVGTTKQGTLYSEKGWYDTRTNLAELYKASKIIGKEQSLQGDTIFYSRDAGSGRARSRVLLSDTTNHIAITGRNGIYNERTRIAFVTDSAIFMQFNKKDTLFLHADTLKSVPDVPKKEIVKKSSGLPIVAKKSNQAKVDSTKAANAKIAEMHKKIGSKNDSLVTPADSSKRMASTEKSATDKLLSSTMAVADTGKMVAKLTSPLPEIIQKKDTLVARADTLKKIALPEKSETAKLLSSTSAVADTGKKVAKMASPLTEAVQKKDSPVAPADTTQKIALPEKSATSKVLSSPSAVADTGKIVAKLPPGLTLKSLKKDSVSLAKDTLKGKNEEEKKIFMAYHRVRFFKKDLQGICDSLSYQMKDSVMKLYKDPVLWSEVHQMTAEKIEYRPHHPGPDIARLENNGFIISREDSIKFNQISGKVMIGYIYNNALKTIEVNGNAVTLYYLKNKDRYSGMNKLESSKINVYLLKGKIDSISFFPKPEGKTIPMKDLTPDEAMLKGFLWRESEKPKSRFDLYPLDEKRKKIAGSEKKPATKK